jgi:hypothetical protein
MPGASKSQAAKRSDAMTPKAGQPRDWNRHPPTLAEVKAYRRERKESAKRPIFVNLSAEGAAEITAMIEAEKRFQAMGLIRMDDLADKVWDAVSETISVEDADLAAGFGAVEGLRSEDEVRRIKIALLDAVKKAMGLL